MRERLLRKPAELRRAELRRAYGDLFDQSAEIPFATILPASTTRTTPTNEPEVGTILPRLQAAASSEDVRQIVREEFAAWFNGAPCDLAAMDAAADELWDVWRSSPFSQEPFVGS